MVDSGLVRPVKITVTKGLNQPWWMAFLPDGGILITERGGKLRLVRDGKLDPNPVAGLPDDIQAAGLAGLMDIQLHPKFAENKHVYLTYHKRQGPPRPPAPRRLRRGAAAGPPGHPVITLARGTLGRHQARRYEGHFLRSGGGQSVAHSVRPRRVALHVDRLRRSAGRRSG